MWYLQTLLPQCQAIHKGTSSSDCINWLFTVYTYRYTADGWFTLNLNCLKWKMHVFLHRGSWNPSHPTPPHHSLTSLSHHQHLRRSRTPFPLKLGTRESTRLQKGKYFSRSGIVPRDAQPRGEPEERRCSSCVGCGGTAGKTLLAQGTLDAS